MSEDHQKSRGVSPCWHRAQAGRSAPVSALTASDPALVSEGKDRWLCGPRASECPASRPLRFAGPKVRSDCSGQTGDSSREDAGKMWVL